MSGKRRPAVLDLPSGGVVAVAVATALTLGVFLFPFLFHAFGPHDSPFERPIEFAWIVLLAASFLPVIAVIVVVRRAVLKIVEG